MDLLPQVLINGLTVGGTYALGAVGVSLVFSLTKITAEHGRPEAIRRIVRRALLLVGLGIFYNGGLANAWPAHPSGLV